MAWHTPLPTSQHRWYDKSNFLAVPIHTQVTHNPSIYLFLRDVAWQMTLTCGTIVLSAFNTKPSSDNSATKVSDSFFTSKADRGKKRMSSANQKTMGSGIPYDKSKARSPTFTFHFRMAKCNTVQQDRFKTHPSRTPPVMLNVSSDLTIRCPVQIARRIFSKTSMPSVFCDTFLFTQGMPCDSGKLGLHEMDAVETL